MTTKLEVYNIAMRYLGAVRLHPTNGLTENRPDRKELDAVYDHSLALMLLEGIWYYAIRTIEITADPDIEPAFGFPYAYAHPEDFVALAKISNDPYLRNEIGEFSNENKVIACSYPSIYMSYISNGTDYGLDLGKMSAKFVEAWGCRMAMMTGLPVTGQRNDDESLEVKFRRRLDDALGKEALDQRVKGKPPGRWTQSRGFAGGNVHIRNGRIGWRG
jgi:hypothetical protein